MSGKPNKDGVADAIATIERLSNLDGELQRNTEEIARLNARNNILQRARNEASIGLGKCLRDMDLVPGNTGFSERAVWFLAEMKRQVENR